MEVDETHNRPAGDGAAQPVVVGLLADPGLPTQLAEELAEMLPEVLANKPGKGMRYRFVVVTESLRRLGDDRGQRLIDRAAERAQREGWDFVVAVTDLPVHENDRPLVAELSRDEAAALLVVPALNVLKPTEEARDLVAGVILEWAARNRSVPDPGPLPQVEDLPGDLHPVEPEDDDVDLRVTRSAGPLWMLAGMVWVNRPWRLVLGLRGAIAAAVATAAFGLVNGPVWEISGAISAGRLWVATALSVMTMVGWLILNHDLWQRAPDRTERRRIRLYNAATVLTLVIGVAVSYVVLLVGNVFTGWFIVVPEVLSGHIGRPVDFLDHVRLAWLVSSLATIGGALGSGLESTDTVRSATWGSRYRPVRHGRHSSQKEPGPTHRTFGRD